MPIIGATDLYVSPVIEMIAVDASMTSSGIERHTARGMPIRTRRARRENLSGGFMHQKARLVPIVIRGQ